MKGVIKKYGPTYWEFVHAEAGLIGSDGCSKVSGLNLECCEEHDLGYRHGCDPRSAYRHFREGIENYWALADRITRGEVDKRFRVCLQARSLFGIVSPMAWWRWAGVRVFGKGAYRGQPDA